MAKKITSKDQDYSQWYNDIVQGADLAENSGVKNVLKIKMQSSELKLFSFNIFVILILFFDKQ